MDKYNALSTLCNKVALSISFFLFQTDANKNAAIYGMRRVADKFQAALKQVNGTS
jgi:hypothetical protein